MPSRKKPASRDVKEAIEKSLKEWGVPSRSYQTFTRELLTQATKLAEKVHDDAESYLPVELPSNRELAIQTVFTAELKPYLIPRKCKWRSRRTNDALEKLLSPDEYKGILKNAPYFILYRWNESKVVLKNGFKSINPKMLDPFKRFTLAIDTRSPSVLAFYQLSAEDSLLAFAFKAITASYAVHNKSCFRCHGKKTLHWSGGGEAWRDLFCSSCKSCFAIKSKEDEGAIHKIFKHDNFYGSYFKSWCKEDHKVRTIGSDYIVFVNRTPCPCTVMEGKMVWSVEIAEIGTVLPTLYDLSFCEADDEDDKFTLKTKVTLRNRSVWFHIPASDNEINLMKIFRVSFDNVFPGEWSNINGHDSDEKDDDKTTIEPKDHDQLLHGLSNDLKKLQVANWEDSDSEDD